MSTNSFPLVVSRLGNPHTPETTWLGTSSFGTLTFKVLKGTKHHSPIQGSKPITYFLWVTLCKRKGVVSQIPSEFRTQSCQQYPTNIDCYLTGGACWQHCLLCSFCYQATDTRETTVSCQIRLKHFKCGRSMVIRNLWSLHFWISWLVRCRHSIPTPNCTTIQGIQDDWYGSNLTTEAALHFTLFTACL